MLLGCGASGAVNLFPWRQEAPRRPLLRRLALLPFGLVNYAVHVTVVRKVCDRHIRVPLRHLPRPSAKADGRYIE